jgi:hypothetical protein
LIPSHSPRFTESNASRTTAASCQKTARFCHTNGKEERMSSRASNGMKRKVEQIIKLKKKIGLPIGDVWNYRESDADKVICLLKNYARKI